MKRPVQLNMFSSMSLADDVKLLEWAREYHNARKSRKRMRQIEAEL